MSKFQNKRKNKDKILFSIGVVAISVCLLFLVILFGSLFYNASSVFTSYEINAKTILPSNSNYNDFFSSEEQSSDIAKKDWLLASSKLSQGLIENDLSNFIEHEQNFIHELIKENKIRKTYNLNFFLNKESREPELAGILTSFVGSIYTILICLIFSLPIAVCAAIYLEEFAPKNIFTSLIEVNINNLAAVPSIVFGLLGLAVLIVAFELPRSASITAGITLAMMVMPTMIITTRQAFRVIPKDIKHAALALGATKTQVILHHTLPLALPGIMTGVILSISRAIGETAPLIIIGMLAFIVDVPKNIFDPATVMPVQIFLWADSLERAFVAKTSAAILFLLAIMIILNLFAVYIRKKYEKRW